MFFGREFLVNSDIVVKDTVYEGEHVRMLLVDGAGESAVFLDPEKKNDLVFDYAKNMAALIAQLPECRRVLLLGGAGFSLPRYFLNRYPFMEMDVVEKSLRMLYIAKRYFDIDRIPRMKVYRGDGLKYLKKTENHYDLIINDAFNGFTPAQSLLSNEAAELIRERLNPEGVYLINLITALEGEYSMPGIMTQAILRNHFSMVMLKRCKEWKDLTERQNCIITATNAELKDYG